MDIGSLIGCSTMLWCAHSKAGRVISIDPWEDAPWNESLRRAGTNTIKESFLGNVTDPRVEPIQGYSPQCAANWSDPIDLYWEDGDHSNPTCAASIQFWTQHVRPGGIACGHDYHLPDELRLFGSVWSISKPH